MNTQSNTWFLQHDFTGWVRIHLSPSHLYSAFYLALLSQQTEQRGNPQDQMAREQHNGLVIGAILASVAFLEAAINELYSATCNPSGQEGLSRDIQERLSAMWEVENFRRGARILEKFQVALHLAGQQPLPKGDQPYQDAKLLVDLRNALVHFVPTWSPIQGQPGVDIPLDEFGKQLRGKFAENPWKPKYAMISTEPGPKEATWPFFPEGCLGSGCAYWAAHTGLAFADRFFSTLGIRCFYEHLRSNLPTQGNAA